MSQADELVQQAVAAFKAGQKEHSRNLLLQAIEVNEHHELAWLWLSAVVDDLEEQQICLENVLALNPANERARKGLETVNQKMAERQARAAEEDELGLNDSALSFAPPKDPAARTPIGAEHVDAPDSSPFNWTQQSGPGGDTGAASEPAFEDWLAAAAQHEDDAPFSADSGTETSVDWARSDGPAVHGSGRKVELPSSQEFDEWVDGLNLSESPGAVAPSPKAEPPDFTSRHDGTLDIFERAESPSPGGGTAPFSGDSLAGNAPVPAFDSSLSFDEDDWFSPEERAGFGNVFTLDDVDDEESGSESFNFDFDADEPKALGGDTAGEVDKEDDDDDWLSERLGSSIGVAPAFSTPDVLGAAAADSNDYFAYIPAGIEAQSGISRRGLLLLAAIVVLIILNALSFGLLVL
jgi:tetratricopeptide (TPR) repeat protein